MRPKTGTPDTHPDEALLAGYAESPDSDEFREVRRHLTSCSACRKTVVTVQAAVRAMRTFPSIEIEPPSGDHPDEMTLADYVDKRLAPSRHEEIARHVEECGFCTKAALHYATHSAATQRDQTPIVDVAPQRLPEVTREKLPANGRKRGVLSWRMPVWIGVPATAAATAVLVLIGLQARDRQPVIVAFQDNPVVVFSPAEGAPPGIGFFGSAREQTKPFGGLTVRRDGDRHLVVKWAAVEGAVDYSLQLSLGDSGNGGLIGRATTTGATEARVAVVRELQPGRRYEWALSGHTQDNGIFVARGSFVLGEQ